MIDVKNMPEAMKKILMMRWKPIALPSVNTPHLKVIHKTLHMIYQRMESSDAQIAMIDFIGAVVLELACMYSGYHALTDRGEINGSPAIDATVLGQTILDLINNYPSE